VTHATPVTDEIRRAPPLAHGGGRDCFGLEWGALGTQGQLLGGVQALAEAGD
jgi:hypothetical protein